MLTLKRTTSDDPVFKSLILELDADLSGRYGELQKQYDKHNHVALDTAVVAYVDQHPAGCGCFKTYDDATIEVKRMFVRPSFRGRGISKAILGELEKWAAEKGYKRSVLETGDNQPEAIGLYLTSGYGRIENYGPYAQMPTSMCFARDLSYLKP